jgi:hypothetical protein
MGHRTAMVSGERSDGAISDITASIDFKESYHPELALVVCVRCGLASMASAQHSDGATSTCSWVLALRSAHCDTTRCGSSEKNSYWGPVPATSIFLSNEHCWRDVCSFCTQESGKHGILVSIRINSAMMGAPHILPLWIGFPKSVHSLFEQKLSHRHLI